MMERLKSY